MKKQVCMMMAAVMAAVALTGCSGGTKETAAATEAETTQATATAAETEAEAAPAADLSGSISMVGSTSMEKFANALSESFMEKYPQPGQANPQRFWLRRRPALRTPMRMN